MAMGRESPRRARGRQWWACAGLAVMHVGSACVARGSVEFEELETSGGSKSSGDTSIGDHRPFTSCADLQSLDGLPYALAWAELIDGTPALRVHVQSYPISCAQRDGSVSHGSQIRMEIPVTVDWPTRLDLAAVDAYAVMSPGGPGNVGSSNTIAWLTGTVDVDELDGDRIVGAIHDVQIPFDGCFEAPVCPD